MKVGKLVPYLASLYKAGEDIGRFSVLLLGAPGIGKSYSLKETAKSIARRVGKTFIDYSDDLYETIMKEPDKYFVFIDFRLTECEPSDLSGKGNFPPEYLKRLTVEFAFHLSYGLLS